MPYTFNDDGSVTKKEKPNQPPEPPKSNNGCGNFIIGVIVTWWIASIIPKVLETFNIDYTVWGWTDGGIITGVAIVSIIVGIICANSE